MSSVEKKKIINSSDIPEININAFPGEKTRGGGGVIDKASDQQTLDVKKSKLCSNSIDRCLFHAMKNLQ